MLNLVKKTFAEGFGGTPPSGSGGLNIQPPAGLPKDVYVLISNITTFLLTIVAPLAALMILWGAFQILTAAGSPERLEAGKKTIFYAVVGLGLIILSSGIVSIIRGLLGA